MKKLLTIVLGGMLAMSAMAVPAKRGLTEVVQPDGSIVLQELRGDEFYHWTDTYTQEGNLLKSSFDKDLFEAGNLRREQAAGMYAERAAKTRALSRSNGVRRAPQQTDDINIAPRGLVLLVEFTDTKFTYTRNHFEAMMNGSNYTFEGATGSALKYFTDQSNGAYTPQFDVVGPITLGHSVSYYGANSSNSNDARAVDMVIEACRAVNDSVDFSLYDNDRDGYVDFVYIFYAGKGEADGGGENTIWPHSYNVAYTNQVRLDGKNLGTYACSNELDNYSNTLDGVGTFCHEFSHVLGLPDYYDTEYGSNYNNDLTPGRWSVMDAGSYNNGGKTPPNYSAHDKYFFGWATPTRLSSPRSTTLPADGATYYAITDGILGATSTSIIYYLENRQQTGWDAALPGSGMMVTKVEYNERAWDYNYANNYSVRYDVIRADGVYSSAKASDLFPAGATSYTPIADCPLTNIRMANRVVTFDFMGGDREPCTVQFSDHALQFPTLTETNAGAGILLPEISNTCNGWKFVGWSEEDVNNVTERPTLHLGGSQYFPTKDTILYATYKSVPTINPSNWQTASLTSFTATAGSINSVVSFEAVQGEGTQAPQLIGDTILRLYESNISGVKGSYVILRAANGYHLQQVEVKLQNKTKISYVAEDEESEIFDMAAKSTLIIDSLSTNQLMLNSYGLRTQRTNIRSIVCHYVPATDGPFYSSQPVCQIETGLEDVTVDAISVHGKTITLPDVQDGSIVMVVNMMGQVMEQCVANHAPVSLTMPHSGLYILAIGRNGEWRSEKILIP